MRFENIFFTNFEIPIGVLHSVEAPMNAKSLLVLCNTSFATRNSEHKEGFIVMSKIRINETDTVNGSFSFRVSLDKSGKIPVLVIEGVLESPDRISSVTLLENERYRLTGVVLQSESYGSEEDNVAYEFIANKYEIKLRR